MRYIFLLLATALSCACASQPPTEQYLDPKTGATIMRIDTPFYLYRRIARVRDAQVQYVQMAPIYVNRAGKRQLYLWIESQDVAAPPVATLQLDGQAMSLDLLTSDRRSIGLGEHVYSRTAGYGVSGYYTISAKQLRQITLAQQLSMTAADGKATYTSAGENAKAATSTQVLLQGLVLE